MATRIEDYALIGDCQTVALVSRAGSVDWLCVPRFDSGACFAALLGTPQHGRWLLAPADEVRACRRRYLDDTLVLETEHETPEEALRETVRWWQDWSGRCDYDGPWRDAVVRSLVTLKALTYEPTGGLVAAATTSLPEWIGGVRNWDYRYCWLRDATFTLMALLHLGYHDEARAWRDWLIRTIAGSPDQIQIMYGVGGERWLPELIVPWLPGYENSSPVRIGNAAYDELQIDVF